MRIKMKTTMAGPEGNAKPGQIVERDNNVALELIRNGYAEAVDASVESDKAQREAAAAENARVQTLLQTAQDKEGSDKKSQLQLAWEQITQENEELKAENEKLKIELASLKSDTTGTSALPEGEAEQVDLSGVGTVTWSNPGNIAVDNTESLEGKKQEIAKPAKVTKPKPDKADAKK